jgi:hypothetical protein
VVWYNFKYIFNPFVEKVNKRAEGRLKISVFGFEAVPSFEQLKPVREGLFDAVFTCPAYRTGEIPVGTGMYFIAAPAKEARRAGLVNIVDEAYRKKANIIHLVAIPDGVGFNCAEEEDRQGRPDRVENKDQPILRPND